MRLIKKANQGTDWPPFIKANEMCEITTHYGIMRDSNGMIRVILWRKENQKA